MMPRASEGDLARGTRGGNTMNTTVATYATQTIKVPQLYLRATYADPGTSAELRDYYYFMPCNQAKPSKRIKVKKL